MAQFYNLQIDGRRGIQDKVKPPGTGLWGILFPLEVASLMDSTWNVFKWMLLKRFSKWLNNIVLMVLLPLLDKGVFFFFQERGSLRAGPELLNSQPFCPKSSNFSWIEKIHGQEKFWKFCTLPLSLINSQTCFSLWKTPGSPAVQKAGQIYLAHRL